VSRTLSYREIVIIEGKLTYEASWRQIIQYPNAVDALAVSNCVSNAVVKMAGVLDSRFMAD
jgi:hypothetical protein